MMEAKEVKRQSTLPFSNLLAIAPHADDETFGAGGLIVRALAEGVQVWVLIAAVTATKPEHLDRIVSSDERMREVDAAMRILGVEHQRWMVMSFTDMTLDTYPQAEIIGRLEAYMDKIRPDAVAVSAPHFHQDHLAVHKATLAALRPTRKVFPSLVLTYELPTFWWPSPYGKFEPDVWVRLTESQMLCKLEAVRAYKSQEREFAAPLSLDALHAQARYRARQIGWHAYAEAFQILRLVV